MQSRRHSFFEANANTWIGLAVSWVLMQLCMQLVPYSGLFWATNVGVGACTIWSLVRGYFLRRHFNSKIKFKVVAVVTEDGFELLDLLDKPPSGTKLYALPSEER